MDAILLPLLQSTDEQEREQLLTDLVCLHAAPLIRQMLRQRLGFYVSQQGTNPSHPDAEDLYSDVLTKLIQLLNDPQLKSGQVEVQNFRQYVARIAINACHDYLRAKSPARSRLKNNLRDLLERHQEFAVWKSDQQTLCGFTRWRTENKPPITSKRWRELVEKPEVFQSARFPHEDIRQAPFIKIVTEVFQWVDSPLEVDVLVKLLAGFLDIKDHPTESLDDESSYVSQFLTDTRIHCNSDLELQEVLRHLWEEVKRLTSPQRDTFCLGFEDENGEDLFSLLVNADVVTLPQLAAALDRSLEQLMSLWQQMPLDSARIANELGASRQQVNKWRFRALRQLEKVLIPITTRK